MNDYKEILKYHCAKYPLFTARDAVKLAVQSSQGGDHLLKDYTGAVEYCKNEIASLTHDDFCDDLFTEIGGGYIRLNLAPASKLLGSDLTAAMFASKIKPVPAGHDSLSLDDSIRITRELAAAGELPFSFAEFDEFIKTWDGSPVSHSGIYKSSYSPHYRVVAARWLPLIPLIAEIRRHTANSDRIIIAIDGMAGSGKSSIADMISALLCGKIDVIHADDFFLPPDMRTDERLSEAGGNFHYERFKSEVADSLKLGKNEFSYRVFDCSVGDYNGRKTLTGAPVTLIEGSYCLHPALGRYADITAYAFVTREEQAHRIRKRNGSYAEMFFKKWIPLEDKYASEMKIRESADLLIDNT